MPWTLYGDRAAILVRNDHHWTVEEELEGRQRPSHVGLMLEELGIRYIAALSPQAKGRIERLWRTLQDRLEEGGPLPADDPRACALSSSALGGGEFRRLTLEKLDALERHPAVRRMRFVTSTQALDTLVGARSRE